MTNLQFTIEFINNSSKPFRMADITQYAADNRIYSYALPNYINLFRKAEYIERIDRGLYQKVSNISTKLTTTELKKLAYDDNYKRLVKIKKIMENNEH